jgi:carbon monoxide dehydrogenase subunit G
MKISGTATLHAPPGQVWIRLNDPAVLASTVPGCEDLEATGPDSYRLTLTTGVASIQGTYTGEVSLTDQQEPTSSRLAVNLAGAPGTLHATVLVLLVPSANGSTEVTYAADAIPDGMIASVGQRLLASTMKQLASDFFASVDDILVAVPERVGADEAPSTGSPPGVRAGGAAGVSSPTSVPMRRASGMTTELPTDDRQPAGRTLARPHTGSFLEGALAGAAATLAGTYMARLLRRRSR